MNFISSYEIELYDIILYFISLFAGNENKLFKNNQNICHNNNNETIFFQINKLMLAVNSC